MPSTPAKDRARHLVASGAVLILLVVAAGALDIVLDRRNTIESAFGRLENLARIADEGISGRLRTVDLMLRDVGHEAREVRSPADDEALVAYMTARAAAFEEVRTISVTDHSGIITHTTLPEIKGFDGSVRPYFTEPLSAANRDRLFIHGPIRTSTGTIVLLATRAREAAPGAWEGVVLSSLPPEYFSSLLASVRPQDDGFASLVSNSGIIVARAPDPEHFMGRSVARGPAFQAHQHAGQRVTRMLATLNLETRRVLVVNRTTEFPELMVAVGADEQAVLAEWRARAAVKGSVLGVLLAFMVLLLTLYLRHDRALRGERNLARQAQGEAAASQRFLQAVTDSVPGMVGYWDAELRCRFANQRHLEWFGRPPEQVVGHTIRELLGERLFALNEPYIRGALAGEVQRFERTLVNASGEEGYTWASYIPDIEPDGTVAGFFALVTDITPVKRAENELRRSNERLSLATRAGGIGVWEYDLRTGKVAWDDRMFEMYGIDPDTAGGNFEMWHGACHPDDRPRVKAELEAALQAGDGIDHEFRIVTSRDGIRHIRAAAIIERDPAGTAVRMVGVNWDITAIRENERALAEARAAAERASRAKSQFLANMSHEIRTPMSAILGLAHLLERSRLTADQREFVSKIANAGRGLLAIINDILDFSRVEAGRLELETSAFQLSRLLDAVTALASVDAVARQLEFTVGMAPGTPDGLTGDALRLQQVLVNLVGNAIKFTRAGVVSVWVEQVGAEDGKPLLRFSVRDTGMGIEPDVLPRLFEAFTQGDSSTTRQFGGSGLGLAISKRLVELMGGRIGVVSRPAEGSTFWFTVPLALAEQAPAPSAAAPRREADRLAGMRLLLVEDNGINRDVAKRILELEGATVATAVDGRKALDRLAADITAFDAVLMDVQMPVMDGYEATRRIRGQLGLGLPIIALTAGALSSERQRAQDCGMNDFIAKPFEVDEMVQCLRRHVAAPAAPGDVPPRPATTQPLRHDLPGIDMRQAMLRLGDDDALLASLLKRFAHQFADACPQARADLRAGNADAAARLLHKLRGASGNVAAVEVAKLSSAAEAAIRDGRHDDVEPLLDRLDQALGLVVAGIGGIAETPPAADEPAAFDPEAVAALLDALDQHSLGALAAFDRLRPGLIRRFGAKPLAAIAEAMEALRFDEAAERLRTLTKETAEP